MFVSLVWWTATLSGSTTNDAPATKSEEASAEDCGSDNFHRNRFRGTTVKIVKRVVLRCQCRWYLKVFFLSSVKVAVGGLSIGHMPAGTRFISISGAGVSRHPATGVDSVRTGASSRLAFSDDLQTRPRNWTAFAHLV